MKTNNSSVSPQKLSPDATRRVSGYLRAFCERHKVTAEQLVVRSGSEVHPKTLAAMMNLGENDTRCWDREKAWMLFRYASEINHYPPQRIWDAIVYKIRSNVPFDSEAWTIRYWHFSHRNAQDLDRLIRRHERNARRIRFFGRVCTCGFMPERMVRHYLKGRYEDAPLFDDRVLQGIRRFERNRHEAIFTKSEAERAIQERYLAIYEFHKLLRREPPFHFMQADDVEEFVERLVVAIDSGLIKFGLTHGAPTRGDTAYKWMMHFESITLIDEDLLIRHEAHRPYMTVAERQEDDFWNQTLNYRVRQMETLPQRLTHKPDPESAIDAIHRAVAAHFNTESQ